MSPRHFLRFTATAVAIGVSAYALAKFLAPSDGVWMIAPRGFEAFDLFLAACYAFGVLAPAWTFRRFLASAPFSATFPASVLGAFLFCFCASFALAAFSASVGVEIEELEGTTGLARVAWIGGLTLLGTGHLFTVVLQSYYVSLPLAWLTVLALRRASADATAPRGPAALSAS